jgi:hypothetical protein
MRSRPVRGRICQAGFFNGCFGILLATRAFCLDLGDKFTRPEPVVFGGDKVVHDSELSNFIVAVHYRGAKSGVPGGCTGILIDPLIVLTAAHCTGRNVKIIFCGPASGPCLQFESRSVVAQAVPEDFAHRALTKGVINTSDIQLLKLDSIAPRWTTTATVTDFYDAIEASAFGIAGFGLDTVGRFAAEDATDPNEKDIEGEELHYARIQRITSRYRGVLEFDQTTGAGGCLGDSGAPVLRVSGENRKDVVGLFHQISSTVTCQARGFAILLSPWLPWITDNVRQLLQR